MSATPPPMIWVPVADDTSPHTICPAPYRDQIVVFTLHDGRLIPPRIYDSCTCSAQELDSALTQQRDWGASEVARELVAALGLGGFWEVQIARVVLDFNRFPGVTPPRAGHLEAMAISHMLGSSLDHSSTRWILETLYDQISDIMDRAIRGRLILLSLHTYDAHNATQTLRPEVSLLYRSQSYQTASRLPHGVFDPLFPAVLAESSVKRVLRDRMALTLEKDGIVVEHNYPYCLPDGSLEIRSQPWLFFQDVRARYEEEHPETATDPAHQRVWHMLLNTNQRDAKSQALQGYLHGYQRPASHREAEYEASRLAYERIAAHMASDPAFVDAHRYSSQRTSAMTIEVRKDLVWLFDGAKPIGPREGGARRIARSLAKSIHTYLTEDREAVPSYDDVRA